MGYSGDDGATWGRVSTEKSQLWQKSVNAIELRNSESGLPWGVSNADCRQVAQLGHKLLDEGGGTQ